MQPMFAPKSLDCLEGEDSIQNVLFLMPYLKYTLNDTTPQADYVFGKML